jgi:hypothetical protein
VQTLLSQSAATEQRLLGTHFEHDPPQSTSVSVPFLIKSVQAAAEHFKFVPQTPLVQSAPTEHVLLSAQVVEQVDDGAEIPPQSMSVSVPFFTESGHFAATHLPLVHTLESQSVAPVQVFPTPHRLQLVEPPQSMSDSPWFLVTSEQLAI